MQEILGRGSKNKQAKYIIEEMMLRAKEKSKVGEESGGHWGL